MTYTKEETREIAVNALKIIKAQNWNAGLPIRFDKWHVQPDNDHPTLVILNKTSSYRYSFYVRYNPGTDEYDTRFGKMYCGNKLSADRDWETSVGWSLSG